VLVVVGRVFFILYFFDFSSNNTTYVLFFCLGEKKPSALSSAEVPLLHFLVFSIIIKTIIEEGGVVLPTLFPKESDNKSTFSSSCPTTLKRRS